MKNINYIDAIETGLGYKLTEKNRKHFERLEATDLAKVALSVEEYEKGAPPSFPPKKVHEIRPYIHPYFRDLSKAISGDAFEFLENNKVQITLNELSKYLLLFHSICIPDNLSYLLDYYATMSHEPPRNHQKLKASIVGFLNFYASLRPLINEGIIVIAPQMHTFFPARDYVNKHISEDEPYYPDLIESEEGSGKPLIPYANETPIKQLGPKIARSRRCRYC